MYVCMYAYMHKINVCYDLSEWPLHWNFVCFLLYKNIRNAEMWA